MSTRNQGGLLLASPAETTTSVVPGLNGGLPDTSDGIVYIAVDVTPQVAGYWLDNNHPNNRKAKLALISKMARDMGEGNWDEATGDTVKVTKDGLLADGSQRMRSVLRCAADERYPEFRGVRMTFAFGVSDNTIRVVDTGASRSFADVLQIEEAMNRTQVGAIVRRIFSWKQGNYVNNRGSSSAYADASMTELLQLYKSDISGFDASAARSVDLRRFGIGNGTAGGTAHYVFSEVDKEATQRFFDGLVSGANLPSRSAIHVLRERLRRAEVKTDRMVHWMNPTEQLYLYCRAWNAWRKDRPVEKLQLPDGRDVTNDKFPTLI